MLSMICCLTCGGTLRFAAGKPETLSQEDRVVYIYHINDNLDWIAFTFNENLLA